MRYLLLLVENEALGANSLYQLLTDNEYVIIQAHTPQKAGEEVAVRWPDLVIFNLVGGHLNWAEANQAIVEAGLYIPRLAVLDQPAPVEPIVEALLHSPYTSQELIAQIDRIVEPDRFLRWGDIILDTHKRALLRSGVLHHLTPKLFDLMMLLTKHEGRIVYRKTIMQEVWETDYMGDTRTLDVHIRWLREKIEDNPSHPKHLLTVRGAGYRFFANL